MSTQLSSKYNPAEVEAGRYQKWLDEDVFKPSGDKSTSLFYRDSTTKCDGEIAPWSRLGHDFAGYYYPSEAHAGL